MNRPISHTILFLFFALLSLIGLQAYFSYNDFQIKGQEFEQTIKATFAEAVELERLYRKNQVLDSIKVVLLDTNRVILTPKTDSVEKRTLYMLQNAKTGNKATEIGYKNELIPIENLNETDLLAMVDKILEIIGDQLDDNAVFYWTDTVGKEIIHLSDKIVVDTNQLKIQYDSLLRQSKVYSDYQIKLLPAQESDSIRQELNYRWQTEILSTDLYSDQWDIIAIFKAPFQDIFRRAWLSIGGSLFIVLLTGLTFFILLRTIFRQKKLAEIKEDFLDNISHELQTPIATLKAANEGMEKYDVLKDSEKTARYIQVQKQAIERLAGMVDELLRSSIYKRTPQKLNLSRIDYVEIIQNVLNRYQLKSSKKIRFTFFDDWEHPNLRTDPKAFDSILDNLIGNAIKHHPEYHLQIEVTCQKVNNTFQLSIADDGLGIKASDQEKIFERFYQVNSKSKGHGLGLAFVQDLVNQLGGNISVGKSPLGGAQFIIQLPQDHG